MIIKDIQIKETLIFLFTIQNTYLLFYATERWDKLSAYLKDGNLHIDNNVIENAIRLIALGRKNYLFAGTHDAAQRAAMIYSFFAICKKA